MTVGDHVRVGCSGWVYRHWKDDFYAGVPQRLWFQHYAGHFDTVEINASFYRQPAPAMWQAWKDKAPPGFVYAIKCNRFITHLKKLAGVEQSTADFLALARALDGHLGPILYQLPPMLKPDLGRLEAFLALLPADLEHVVEFRSTAWYDEPVLDLLDRHGVGFVTHDLVGLVSPRWASGRTAYVRFHGTGGKYHGRYSDEEMESWAEWLVAQRAQGRSAWAYFNNDIGGDALLDAANLQRALEQLGEAPHRVGGV